MVELLSLVLAVLLGFGWATAAVPHAIRPYQTSTAPVIDYNVSPIPISSHKDYAQVYQGRSVKRAKLIVEDGEVTIAGVTTPAALVNGTMPGPTLRFTAGDVVIVNVTNLMQNRNTTMHWHGVSQRQTPRADGTLMSQWPIAPGKWFEYEMHLTTEDIGTRFYHSHVGSQANTVGGAFIVDEPAGNPYNWDEERILDVLDWWHKPDEEMTKGLLAENFKWIGSPNMTLVNGKGLTADLKGEPYYLDVDYEKKYFVRWIGGQGLQYYSIGFLDHTPSMIEVDATWIKEFKGDSVIELGPGNRIGQLLRTKSEDQVKKDGLSGCYGIRLESGWRKPPTNGWAALRYPGGCPGGFVPPNANNTISLLREEQFGWITSELQPLRDYRVLRDDEVSHTYIVDAHQVKLPTMTPNATGKFRWKGAEDYTYIESFPKIPYMIQLYGGLRDRPSYERAMHPGAGIQKGYDSVSQTFVARSSSVIDVVILNNSSFVSNNTEVHVWHFHSSKFQHVASGEGDYSAEALRKAREEKGWKTPLPSDMITVWPGTGAGFYNKTIPQGTSGSWSLFRYEVRADQSGIWPLHCHMVPHLVMGMATIIAIDPERITPTLTFYDDPNYLLFGRNVKAPYTRMVERANARGKGEYEGRGKDAQDDGRQGNGQGEEEPH